MISDVRRTEYRLKAFAAERYERFAHTSLRDAFNPSDDFIDISGVLVDFLSENRDRVAAWFEMTLAKDSPLEYFVENTVRFVQRRNPYILLGGNDRRNLRRVYHTFLAGYNHALNAAQSKHLLREYLKKVMISHKENLGGFIGSLAHDNVSLGFVLNEPVFSEYSPRFQLAVFGIDPGSLLEPVLDIGSGSGAGLVSFLRRQGKAAYGLDRDAPENDCCIRADWLGHQPGVSCWGAVISHMAFSLHFLHHHLRGERSVERYAGMYMEILRSLRPGGSFLYAPGLPFIERFLPEERYRVEKRALGGMMVGEAGKIPDFGEDVWYSCRVLRTGSGL